MKQLTVLALILGSALVGSTESSKSSNHLDEARSSFSPTSSTNTHSRSASSHLYAQNRDSYAQAAGQAGYSAGGGGTGGIGGTSAAASSSYAAPATGGGGGGYGGQPSPGQQSMTYYYYHYPAQQQSGGYGDSTGYQDDDGGFDGAGLGGLAGLLGLKGLKGLGGLGLLALLKLLKPLLLPLLLPFLLLLPLLLLFIPIPVITIPTGRRALEADGLGAFVTERAYQTATLAQEVLTSGLCVERLACELSTRTHGTYVDKMITQVFEKTENLSSKKWRRAMRAYVDSGFNSETVRGAESRSGCAKYSCDLYKEFTSRVNPASATNQVPLGNATATTD